MTKQQKEKIGNDLQAAMKCLDSAVHSIYQIDQTQQFDHEGAQILKARKELKKILNAHFDYLAIEKSESAEEERDPEHYQEEQDEEQEAFNREAGY